MEAIGHDGLAVPGQVVLAHEPPFRMGLVEVEPATRQLTSDDRGETLEPRVMQVLVALYRAGGIVTRDELIIRCWEGRIVGDDAINRVISRIRHIADDIGQGSFSVETITKVGYRLVAGNLDLSASAQGEGAAGLVVGRRALAIGAVATGVAGAFGAAWWQFGRPSGPSQEARLYYDRAVALRGQSSPAQAEQLVGYLREAVRLNPDYSDAWGALAWGYHVLLAYGQRPDAARIEALSRSAAARALELDPDNADAQATLLLLKHFFGHWTEIEQGCRRILRQHARHGITQYNLCWVLNEVGRWRESLPYFRQLSEREPFWPIVRHNYVRALYCSGRLEEMEQLLDDALRRWPRRVDFWQMRIRYSLVTGRIQEALDFMQDPAKGPVEPSQLVDMESIIVRTFADPGANRSAAAEKLATLISTDSNFVNAVVGIALLGQLDLAFNILEGYYFGRGRWAFARPDRRDTLFLFFPYLSALRSDKRFARLIQEIGLEDYWRASGSQPDYRRS